MKKKQGLIFPYVFAVGVACFTTNVFAENGNIIIDDDSGTSTTDGKNNTIIGQNSSITGGKTQSIAIGNNVSITGSDWNVAIGENAQVKNGWGSTAVGRNAIADGYNTTALGNWAEATSALATAVGTSAKARHVYAVAVGTLSEAHGAYSIATGVQSRSHGYMSTAIGPWAEASANHSIALGNYSVAKKEDVVSTASTTINGTTYQYAGGKAFSTLSIGTTNNERAPDSYKGPLYRTVTNMAAGRVSAESTDGVNGSQLYALTQEVEKSNAAIGQLNSEMYRGDAMNAALSALKPIAYKENEPTQVMAGLGNYHGRTALAVGAAHYVNERFLAHAGVSYIDGSRGVMSQLGVTYRFGNHQNNKPLKISTQNTVNSSDLAVKYQALEQKVKTQERQLAEQQRRLDRLEALLLKNMNK